MEDDHDDVEKAASKGKGADHGEDFDADLQVSSSAFEALERDFQEVLADLMVDESLEKFRLEYEKLHRALKKSHEQEKRLVKKCRELNSEILNNQAKIKTALRLSQEDQKTITHLQKEMEKTWKLVYMSQEKEARAKETIGQLKEEMINLSKLVERGAGLSMSQETVVKELKQAKEELQLIVEEQAAKLQLTENQLMTQNKVQDELRDERDESNRQMGELRERLQARENDNARELKRREKTQKELQDVRSKFDEEMKVEEQVRGDLAKSKQHAADLEKQLADAKATIEKCLRDYDALLAKTQKVTDDLESQVKQNKKMLESQQAMEKELGLKRIEVSRLNTDNGLLQKKLDKEHRSAQHYQQMAEDAKTPLSVAQNEIESLKKELLVAHRHELQLNREAEKTLHEKEVQQKMASRMEAKAKEASDLVTEKKRNVENLESEIDVFKQEVGELKKAIYQLERDRERLGNEVSEQRNNVFNASEEIKLKDIQISEFKKRITEWENKLKQQQQLYETVRADRNHYSKGLLESQDEIAELKKKFKIMGHQIEQLKGSIVAKDQAIVKEHFEFQRSEKLKDNVMSELNRKNLMIQSNHDLIHQQENELRNLSSALRRMDEEALSQRKEYDQVINERDILGTQLIRRNDELALLYEKLRIQDSVQYMSRMDDIRVMRVKLKELVREHAISKSISPQIEELKREVLQLQKELLQEKTKVTALSEELENPMNVHRWRKLEGSDPATFELIQKIQTLQRRLIAKTEEVVEKGLVIQEKEKLYNELKAILARQPGPEVAEQLTVYQQNLKKKNVQMKAMASELNMYQAQVNESKYEQERLSRELTEMKRKYYLQKRKEKIVEDMEYEVGGNVSMSKSGPISIHQEQTAAAKNARIRYTGGGYAIN
eukprot:gene27374-36141_t